MQRTSLTLLFRLALFILFLAGMATIQFAAPDLPDNDGFYHIKLAELMRQEGLTPNFKWLPLTILNAREYYDHHFLFHVLLTPFTFGDLRLGAKWAAVVFASLAFLAVWWLLYRQRVPWAWLWALGLLGISDAFLYRMSITRAQSLSLALLALACILLLEGKHKHLVVLSFVYVWTYNAFPLMLGVGGAYFLAIALIERRLDFKPLLYIGAGLMLGLILNPYFPENLIFSYRHMFPKLTDATAVSVGNEWYPYDTGQILENSLPALVALAGGILALGLAGRKMDVRTAFSLFLVLLFGLMFLQARRFVEYFPPFVLIFTAFAWTPLLKPEPDSVTLTASPRKHLAALLLSLAIAASITVSIPRARDAVDSAKSYDLYADASAWLSQNTPADSRVFQTDWDDFPRLFFYNTHNTYLIGLDPTYLQLYDPDMYNLWVAITRGRVERPAQIILKTFGAHYVHTDLNHGSFLRVAENDPGLKEVFRDEQAVLFEVILP